MCVCVGLCVCVCGKQSCDKPKSFSSCVDAQVSAVSRTIIEAVRPGWYTNKEYIFYFPFSMVLLFVSDERNF